MAAIPEHKERELMDYVFITGWVHGPGQGGLNQFRFDPETGAMEYMCNLYPETSFGTAFFSPDLGQGFTNLNHT